MRNYKIAKQLAYKRISKRKEEFISRGLPGMYNHRTALDKTSEAKTGLLCRTIKLGALALSVYHHMHNIDLSIAVVVKNRISNLQFFQRRHLFHLEIAIRRFFILFKTYITKLNRPAIYRKSQMPAHIIRNEFIERRFIFF